MVLASDLMRMPVVSVCPETPVEEAIDRMLHNELSGVPVIDSDGTLVGMFSESDHVQNLTADRKKRVARMHDDGADFDRRQCALSPRWPPCSSSTRFIACR